jgi:nitrate reductase NapE component
MLGWFPNSRREWIEFILATVLLWLLMMVAIHELELRTVG